MLEDTNFFLRLGEDTHIDPLLKDYMQFACQMYVQHLPDKGKIMSDNLPGHHKRQKTDSMTGSTMVNLAQVQLDWTNNTPVCHETEEECLNSTWSNTPVVFIQHLEIQQSS
eukprot:7944545-Ditylum_brightwellii.AAC.1